MGRWTRRPTRRGARKPLIRYLLEVRRGASNARNTGVQHAGAKLIAFLDDDLLPAPDWLPSIKQTMEAHPEVDCVGGRIEPQWPGARPAWLTPRTMPRSRCSTAVEPVSP